MSSAGEPVNVFEYERLAEERLDHGAYGYFAEGAGDELTLRGRSRAPTCSGPRADAHRDAAENRANTGPLSEKGATSGLRKTLFFARTRQAPGGEAVQDGSRP